MYRGRLGLQIGRFMLVGNYPPDTVPTVESVLKSGRLSVAYKNMIRIRIEKVSEYEDQTIVGKKNQQFIEMYEQTIDIDSSEDNALIVEVIKTANGV